MSAGSEPPRVNNSLDELAPKFRAGVEAALAECQQLGLDAMVFETYRSNELQALYYARGRTIKPPDHTVTNAHNNEYSWHGYGLAVDVVHRTLYWKPPGGEEWFAKVAEVFKRHDCNWGGDWRRPDTPHFQWHLCKPSPSETARTLLRSGGRPAVWAAVSAA